MDNNTPIAIIGMSCRFAGDVTNPSKLWDLCAEGRSAWSEIPSSRFNMEGIYHPNHAKPNTSNVKGGHFLTEDVGLFDANFFNFSSETAASLDPQFRLQLETTYEALENAGISLQQVAGSDTSVFAGAFFRDYYDAHFRDPETLPRFLLMGVGSAMASNRISHWFDLRGPSMSIDTGCSTTLTALHQACQNLRCGESKMSIVGGANVMLNPDNFVSMSTLTMLSAAGKSYTFDSRASGYGRGEGSATVVLKRLEDALRDGDPIRSVIRASGSNQDGKTDTITTPSQEAQQQLIRAVYEKSGLDPAHTAYFEAHGTGTPTGDPIEARAIASVFQERKTKEQPLIIGSVKTNVGHTETSSGLASIIKVTKALENGQIPPSINYEKPNERLHLDEWNMKVATELQPWPKIAGVRRASVNNFGYGGTNAHVILEDLESYFHSTLPRLSSSISNGHINAITTNLSGLTNGHANGYANTTKNGLSNGHTGAHAEPNVNGYRQSEVDGLSNDSANDSSTSDIDELSNGSTDGTSSPETAEPVKGALNGLSHGEIEAITRSKLHKSRSREIKPTLDGANGQTDSRLINGVDSDTSSSRPQSRVIALSARDESSTQTMANNLRSYLQMTKFEDEELFLDDLAYTLGQRRSIFPWVAAQPVQSISGLIKAIDTERFAPARSTERPKIGFVFTGQGAQWWAMGRELIDTYPVFTQCLRECDEYLKDFGATWSMMEELKKDEKTSRVNDIALSMPLTAALQMALVQLLRSWGITPTAVTSHSSGEIAAAYAAGALTLKAATAIVYARASSAGNAVPGASRKGGMMAVGMGAEEVQQKYIDRVKSGKVVVACYNSPTSITASGDLSAVEELETYLKEDNVFARRLKVPAAYHSHHMQDIAEPYLEWLQKLVEPEECSLTAIYSSPTTGVRMTSGKEISSPEHWVKSLTNPVQFIQAFRQMCFADPSAKTPDVNMVIEIGPHAALSGPIADIMALPDLKQLTIPYATCLVRKNSAVDTMHTLACELRRSGYPVKLEAVNFPHGKDHVQVLQDLPPYPWNHQTRHWVEPRINQMHRQRQHAPHDLLGSLVIGTNMLAPTWRLNVRPSDVPWVRDHQVQGNIIYPGAGFICMAIEAVCQQSLEVADKHLSGYQLRDIDIQQALLIPDSTDGAEVQLTLRPAPEKSLYSAGWKEFQVYSVTPENKWLEHCKGLISAEYTDDHGQMTTVAEVRKTAEYRLRVDPRDVYQCMRSVGIYHGPIFQNMKAIRARHNESISSFAIADTAATMPERFQHEHVLDPTTLDSIFQAAFTALPGAGSKMTTPMIPKSIKKLWVSHNIDREPGHMMRAYSDINMANTQKFDTNIVVIEGDDDSVTSTSPVMTVDGFTFQSIGNTVTQDTDTYANEKISTVKWAPDISYLKPSYLQHQLCSAIDPNEAETLLDLRRLCYYFLRDVLSQLTANDVGQLEKHHKKLYVWMKLQAELVQRNELAPQSSDWMQHGPEETVKLIEKVNTASVNGEMLCRLGPQLLAMLRREVTPLELMLEDKLLHKYYNEGLKWDRSSRQVGELVKHFAHKNPRAKILEIGGGTGGTTTHVLNALGSEEPLAASYDFTDVSSGFFEAAQEKFSEWKDLVRYKKLDIEQDTAKQGFEDGSYDLIVACQVLHATKSMDRTMARVNKLLKPGGKLFLFETTQDQMDMELTFGLLPGWWLSEEEERRYSPSLSVDMWNRVLSRNGFNGVEVDVHDCENQDLYTFSVMMTTATSTTPSFNSDVVLVTGHPMPQESWLEELKNAIAAVTGAVPTVETTECAKVDDKLCIYLGEVGHSALSDPHNIRFEAIKALCTKSKGVLWVTQGGAVDYENPNASLSTGFLRSLRVEYAGKRLINLDLDPKQKVSAATISDVFERAFDYSTNPGTKDFEFAERDGTVQVQRYVKDIERNHAVFPDPANPPTTELEPFHQRDRPLRLGIRTPGLMDSLAFNDDPDAATELQAQSVEIEPSAFGLNFRDILVAMGQLDGQYMGFECAGVVTRVGSDAASQGFKAGDRVAALMMGHYSNLVRVDWTSAVHIPDDMSFETATTLPMSFATAYFCLFEMARMRKGESVLIHAATGGFGQAAIILAKHIGADIFVTVGTEKKRNFVIQKYGIEPDHIFSSRDTSFAPGVLAMTHGKGVDVVLNTLAGALLQESFNCVAQFGRFVEVGKRDLEANNYLEMGAFTRAVSFASIDLLQLQEFKGADVSRVMKEIIRLFNDKVIAPVEPVTVYPLSEIERTFRLMQAGKHMGKIVITVKPDDLVPVLPQVPKARLRSDSSYLIVGGLGGIGKSVCHWMVERGARNLIVLSRSANAQEKARPFLEEMDKLGCKVKAIGADISDKASLSAALLECNQEMPPIRGVIQGAMVLQDSILEQMTIDMYNAAIRPKVHGSWNLHTHFSPSGSSGSQPPLDFFVLLSSLAGVVGFASQSNYSAGGTFQDALARHRTARGLHGAAIDIGIVKSVGYVSENEETAERLRKSGHTILSESDVLGTIESAIVSPPQTQVMLGLNSGPGANWDDAGMSRDSRFLSLKYRDSVHGDGAGGSGSNKAAAASGDLGGLIAASKTLDEATDAVVRAITKKLMNIFMISEAEIAPSNSLSEYGVDSLVAVELRNMLALKAGAEVSIFDIMQSVSIAGLAGVVVAKSSFLEPGLLVEEGGN